MNKGPKMSKRVTGVMWKDIPLIPLSIPSILLYFAFGISVVKAEVMMNAFVYTI